MGGLLSRLGTRGVLVVTLSLLLLVILTIARLAYDRNDDLFVNPGAQPSSTVDPSAGDDAEVLPTPTQGPEDLAVIAAARTFTSRWLQRNLSAKDWHSRLAELSTSKLSSALEGVDPKSVPATRGLSEPQVILRTAKMAQTVMSADGGVLTLTLTSDGDRWLIDEVDWERA